LGHATTADLGRRLRQLQNPRQIAMQLGGQTVWGAGVRRQHDFVDQ
jgi:hypothetical protein